MLQDDERDEMADIADMRKTNLRFIQKRLNRVDPFAEFADEAPPPPQKPKPKQ